jgi:hypothetical protein
VVTLKTGKDDVGIGVEVGEIDISVGISFSSTIGKTDDIFDDNLTFFDGYSIFPETKNEFVWFLDFAIEALS